MPTSSKPSINPNHLAVFVVILLAVTSLFFFTCSLFLKKPADQSDWITYTDQQMGFSIKYPPEVIPSRGNCDSFIYPASEKERASLTVARNSPGGIGLSVNGLEFGFCTVVALPQNTDSKFVNTKLDGYKGIKSETDNYNEYFIEGPNNKILRIWYRTNTPSFKKHFNQLLSTFKFLN